MAFSTLLTLLLLPIVILWIFRKHTDVIAQEGRRGQLVRLLHKNVRRYTYAFPAAAGLFLTASVVLARRFAGDFTEQMEQLALVVTAAMLIWIFQRQRPPVEDFGESRAVARYRSALRLMIKHRYAFTGAGLIAVIAAAFLLSDIGKDFLPETDEGSILYMPSTLPGLPNREAGWVLQQMDKKLKEFPEVERDLGKIGRDDTSSAPAPRPWSVPTVLLRPNSKWRNGMTNDKLVGEMDS